jgi:hypothetical protein
MHRKPLIYPIAEWRKTEEFLMTAMPEEFGAKWSLDLLAMSDKRIGGFDDGGEGTGLLL